MAPTPEMFSLIQSKKMCFPHGSSLYIVVSLACIALRCHCQLCYQIQEHFLLTYLYLLPKLLGIHLSRGNFRSSLFHCYWFLFKHWLHISFKYENLCFVALVYHFPSWFFYSFFPVHLYFSSKTQYFLWAVNIPSFTCMDFCIACSLEIILFSLVGGDFGGYFGQTSEGLGRLESGVRSQKGLCFQGNPSNLAEGPGASGPSSAIPPREGCVAHACPLSGVCLSESKCPISKGCHRGKQEKVDESVPSAPQHQSLPIYLRRNTVYLNMPVPTSPVYFWPEMLVCVTFFSLQIQVLYPWLTILSIGPTIWQDVFSFLGFAPHNSNGRGSSHISPPGAARPAEPGRLLGS